MSAYYTVSQKMSHLWLVITLDTCERILIFFRRNVTNKISNQNTLYYAPQITCASALPSKNMKIFFFTQMLY